LVALEIDPEPLQLARKAWKSAEVESKIDLRVGPADVSLAQLIKDSPSSFDFIFIGRKMNLFLNQSDGL